MATKDGRGGRREGAGRKPKSEEMERAEKITKGIENEYGGAQDFWDHVAKMSKDDFRYVKLIVEQLYGKPHQAVSSDDDKTFIVTYKYKDDLINSSQDGN
ncbi:MAG: hypothetical protein AAF502_21100 [Bacteroidota bacterium]